MAAGCYAIAIRAELDLLCCRLGNGACIGVQLESSLVRYFRAVYRERSIRQASALLNVAPSALSRQLHRLEDMVGSPLFERRPRGLTPTEAGEILARFALTLEMDTERVRAEIDSLRGLQRGQIRIMATEGLIADFLNRVIARFHDRFPGITFTLSVAGTDAVASAVHNGEADIGLAFNAETDPQLRFAIRIRDPLCAVMGPHHPLANAKNLRLAEVLKHAIALPAKSFGIRRLVETACLNAKMPLKPSLETNSVEALRGFARLSSGVTFLPTLPIKPELNTRTLVSIPIREELFQRTTHDICILRDRQLPRAVTVFIEHLQAEAEPFQKARPSLRREQL